MKRSFSLYNIVTQASKCKTEETPELGTLEDFIIKYNPTWKPTAYQRKIGEVITYYVDLAKKTDKRYFIFISAPPQHGKSAIVSGHYPAYHLAKYPSDNILLWTHSVSLSQDFSYTNREILLENDLPAKLLTGSKRGRAGLTEWKTSENGGFKASGLKSQVTGKGYNLVICDDLFPGESEALSKAWNMRLRRTWDSSINKRLRKGGVFLFPSVRYGIDDLLGYVQKQRIDGGYEDSIVNLNFTAIAEENDIIGRKVGEPLSHLFPIEVLLDIKATTPAHLWEAQYRGKPTRATGIFYAPEYFIYGKEEGEFLKWTIAGQDYLANKKNCRFFQFWDTSVKASESSDFSACTTVAYCKIANKHYIIIYDIYRKQLNTSQLLPALKEQFRKFPQVRKIFIEQAVSGYGLLESALSEKYPVAPIFTKQKSKEDRAIPQQGLYMSSSIIHVKSKNGVDCDWLPVFEDELLSFPTQKCDQVDSANYSGIALIHDQKVARGELKEPAYGILDSDQIIRVAEKVEAIPSFSDRIFSKSQKYFEEDE